MRCLAFCALLFSPMCVRAAEPDAAAVDKLVVDALKAWDAPGAAVVIVRGDQVIHLKGYGRKQFDKPDPVTPDTLFPIASCTKAFTSTLIAMLVDDGKMNWDDPVRDHLPGFKLADPKADEQVTLRDLMSHRTGVRGNDLLWYGTRLSVDDVIGRTDKLPAAYPFRGGFDYNSIMFMAAGRAAANRTKQPWEALVKDRITAPLGMSSVRFTTKDIPANADRAVGHEKKTKLATMPGYDMPEANPSGSIYASARDLGAWLKFHLADGTVGGKRLVSGKNLNETKSPQNTISLEGLARVMNPDTEKLQYGMGWVLLDHRGKRVQLHGGQIDGFRTQITLLPDEKLGIAIVNNLHETRMNQALTNNLIDLYCGLSARDWNDFFLRIVGEVDRAKRAAIAARDAARKRGTTPRFALSTYAGEYKHAAYGTAKITEKDGVLTLEWGRFCGTLEHFENDTFRAKDGYFEDKLFEFTGTGLRFGENLVFERPR